MLPMHWTVCINYICHVAVLEPLCKLWKEKPRLSKMENCPKKADTALKVVARPLSLVRSSLLNFIRLVLSRALNGLLHNRVVVDVCQFVLMVIMLDRQR